MVQALTFEIEPVQRFSNTNAAIRRPREITYFSYDEDHRFRLDASSLNYYYPPSLPADLSKGFDTFRQLDDSGDDHLDGLIDALIAFERGKGVKTEVDVITWRGMVTKIMTAPFSHLDEWEMNATFFQDTIFIEENHAKKLDSRQKQNNSGAQRGNMSQDLMSFWGYKFETLSLMPATWSETSREFIEGREDAIVSNYAQYCSIVRTGFGKTKLIIGGEVDAVEAFKPQDTSQSINWIELKTTAEVANDRDVVKLERKLLKFWAQSFLLGVPKIVVGYRSQQGVLQRLEEIDTQTIPERVLRGKRMWDGQTCINFTSAFLEWLKSTITQEGTWRIRKREKVPVLEVFRVEETGTGDILSQPFLDWRTNELPTLKGAEGGQSPVVVSNGQEPDTGSAVPDSENVPGEAPSATLDARKTELLAALHKAVEAKPP